MEEEEERLEFESELNEKTLHLLCYTKMQTTNYTNVQHPTSNAVFTIVAKVQSIQDTRDKVLCIIMMIMMP